MCIQHCGDNGFTSIKMLVTLFCLYFGEKPAEKMDRGQHMSQHRGEFFILNENLVKVLTCHFNYTIRILMFFTLNING